MTGQVTLYNGSAEMEIIGPEDIQTSCCRALRGLLLLVVFVFAHSAAGLLAGKLLAAADIRGAGRRRDLSRHTRLTRERA